MPFTFPTSPNNGAVFNQAGWQYVYRSDKARWTSNGFIGPDPDPFASFVSTTYASDGVTTTTHIGMHDENPFNFAGSGNGAGIAANSVATSGVVALWDDGFGQGNAILLPTNLVALSGDSIMGSSISTFLTAGSMNVHFVDGTIRGANIGSSSTNFGRTGGGPGQVMSGGISWSIQGTTTGLDAQNISRIDFKIPTGNGATGTAGQTVALLIERATVVKTLTSTNSTGSSDFYNYRWGTLSDTFVDAGDGT